MNHLAFHIQVSRSELRETLLGLLPEVGVEGIEELDDQLIAYAKSNGIDGEQIKKLLERLGCSYTIEVVNETNWNQSWESNFEPVVIAGAVQIRASFHKKDEEVPYSMLITPKMSFGTGHHATTRMMIKLILNHCLKGASVMDFGTGTGVLAILSEMMGAKHVVAIDVDDWSIANAAENFALNGCNCISIIKDDSVQKTENFDIVLANINKNVLLDQANELHVHIKKNGFLFVSGLLSTDYEDICKAYSPMFGPPFVQLEENGWIALGMRKS